ncbi:MAG: S9 family peptidase [Taibaiella sp.]|nr:S9 family peptidase [Taibaiella sp.]
MNRIFPIPVFLGMMCLCLFQAGTGYSQKKKITLEDIFLKNTFAIKQVPGFTPLHDERFYTAISTDKVAGQNVAAIVQYEVQTRNKAGTILSLDESQADGDIQDYVFSEDESKLLLFFNGENIYRRSILYNVMLYDRDSKKMTPISEDKILHATFSPKGDKIAYVYKNNIYIYDIASGQRQQITQDGRWNYVINGNCDWVYEEEFGFTQAYQWSPDGKRIAYYRFDESRVREYAMTRFNGLYPEQYVYKYPKAGEDNSVVSIHIYEVGTRRSHTVDVGTETDQYIPRIQWANEDELCVLRLNRLQNKLDYLFYNVHKNSSQPALTDDNEYYVDILDPLVFIRDGAKMLFQSERDGYNHLYLLDRISGKVKQITKGEYDVDQVPGYDPEREEVYFTAGIDQPVQRNLYAVSTRDGRLRKVTKVNGWVKVSAFPSMKKFLVNSSNMTELPVFTLIDNNGKVLSHIESNEELKDKMASYQWGRIESRQFLADDGSTSLNAWVIYPPDFKETGKYPVLMYQYSGPGSQEVKDVFPLGNYWWHQYMAQEGYIVVCVDGRGTGGRGQEFRKSTYLQLGNLESADQIAVARQLGRLSYVDASRIGIWGWSYGGFMSATCLLKGHDIFKTAVSVAPVTNWRFYDNIYTERFMRTPQENPEGYDDNSPLNMASLLEGNLLLIHGTADDNVHFQNSVMLTDALIRAGKQFESIYYPDKDHGIYGGNTRYQLFTRITDYIKEHL